LDDAASAAFQVKWDQLRGASSPRTTPEEDPNFMMNIYARCMEGVPEVSINKLCDHIDHVVSLVGPEHVGLGSDWDGATVVVKGLETCADLPSLNQACKTIPPSIFR
jgi:microsomal dipeptidase-like Zn-dependent dipeptidase